MSTASKKRHPTPAKYRAPLRSMVKQREYLLARRDYNAGHGERYLFAFNVKDRGSDLSFDKLLAAWVRSGYAEDGWVLFQPEYLAALRAEHGRLMESGRLWDYAVEAARDMVSDADTYRMLWDAEEADIDVAYEFAGRSGGRLVIAKLEGMKFGRSSEPWQWREWLEGMDAAELRRVYRFIVQCEADFTPEAATAEIEWKAAFQFFANCIHDIPKPVHPAADLGAGI